MVALTSMIASPFFFLPILFLSCASGLVYALPIDIVNFYFHFYCFYGRLQFHGIAYYKILATFWLCTSTQIFLLLVLRYPHHVAWHAISGRARTITSITNLFEKKLRLLCIQLCSAQPLCSKNCQSPTKGSVHFEHHVQLERSTVAAVRSRSSLF
jgi:hypothetical protein